MIRRENSVFVNLDPWAFSLVSAHSLLSDIRVSMAILRAVFSLFGVIAKIALEIRTQIHYRSQIGDESFSRFSHLFLHLVSRSSVLIVTLYGIHTKHFVWLNEKVWID